MYRYTEEHAVDVDVRTARGRSYWRIGMAGRDLVAKIPGAKTSVPARSMKSTDS